MESKLDESELRQFIGTENYYRDFLGILITDGIKYLAERAKCYWLITDVASYQPDHKDKPFQLWSLKVNPDKTASLTMKEDSDMPTVIKQEYGYTDFPMENFSFYVCNNVMMLKSEY